MQSRIDEGGGALALIARDWPYAKVLPSTFASFGMRKCCAQENIGGKLDGANQPQGCCCCAATPDGIGMLAHNATSKECAASDACDEDTNSDSRAFPMPKRSHRVNTTIFTEPAAWSVKPHSMCGASVAAFKRGTKAFDEVLVPWAECSMSKECLMPAGRTEREGRDKALLTLALRRFYAEHDADKQFETHPLRHTCSHGK